MAVINHLSGAVMAFACHPKNTVGQIMRDIISFWNGRSDEKQRREITIDRIGFRWKKRTAPLGAIRDCFGH